jgi:hypothetical protein
LLQKIFENNIEKSKLFKIQDAKSVKRMCEMIIKILDENKFNTKKCVARIVPNCRKKYFKT